MLPGFNSSDERIALVYTVVSNTHVCEQQMWLRDVHRNFAETKYSCKTQGGDDNRPKVNARHAFCDLLKSQGDIFNLAVHENRILNTVPFVGSNPKEGLQKAADLVSPIYSPKLSFGLLNGIILFCPL